MNIEQISVAQIKPYEKNAKVHTQKQINLVAENIKRFGFTQPLVIDKDNNLIIGHCRLESAKKLGFADVPAVRMNDLSPAEVKALRIADNKSNESAWDMELLIPELKELDTDLLGITGFTIDTILTENPKDDEMPEEVTPTAKLGDLYQLGNHRVICGDATDYDAINTLMDGKIAKMVFTDPPYNINYTGGMNTDGSKSRRKKILNDKMSSEAFYNFLLAVFQNLIKFTQGAFYVCMSSSELHNLWKAFTDGGGHWQEYIIWAKDHFTLSRTDYQQQFEPIMYGLSEKEAIKIDETPDNAECEVMMYGWTNHEWFGGRKQGNVWFFDRPKKSKEHPTMKPVMLCAKAIINSSHENEIVLDTFLGSGSTLIACEKANRICYGSELDPHYVDVIIKRWENYTGKKAVKLNL